MISRAMQRDPSSTGIYIHFPYCIQKCHYCDFYSVGLDQDTRLPDRATAVPAEYLAAFLESLKLELRDRLEPANMNGVRHGDRSARNESDPDHRGFRRFETINTIFFGGGTASLMPPELIREILEVLRGEFLFAANIEITLEGNPENFSADYLTALHELGVTRVNVGLQSFREDLLDSMNRYYDPGRYDAVLENLRSSQIEQIGGDLIYGFPGQTAAEFYDDLERVLAARVNHLSVYSLTLESNTAYAGHVRTGKMIAPGEELQERIFQELPEALAARGLTQYEVSNFSRPGYECRHNLRYWLYESYLGLGPGAHGFDGRYRYGNSRSVANWQKNPAAAALQRHNPLEELPLVYLRLCDTIDANVFREVLVQEGGHPERVVDRAEEIFAQWAAAGYGSWTNAREGASDSAQALEGDRGFRWDMNGLLQLDDRVFEMCDALEATTQPQSRD
ncbi:MAG: radical SAM family heme chaperone HemW [bacterium]|nr:radical SAM family heme chaperone HemW [bacterium]